MTFFKLPSLQRLEGKQIVLASGSPRRKEILSKLGLEFQVVPSTFPETLDKSTFSHAKDYVTETAKQKTLEVFERLQSSQAQPPALVIGADTIVVLGEEILEKPRSVEHAVEILTRLNGKSHYVYTAVCFALPHSTQPEILTFCEETEVVFANSSPELIQAYVDSGEPMDKAGGYGYQGLASFLVSKINGDYYNVVGFPAQKFFEKLNELLENNLI
ncbi:N-acetylserotonin O-methyltransferase-like protein-like protein [Basidiobolus meristosporus CBS 931.73]|uniref:N-acetylserotonin O-methyltransferase-like protein-like protein n=1 Tax=Basidiobolus meristosporus CBS 931.73 TaxID=1314790 RepID=A0A1Y1YLL8_9FUNG|nr:N-acetylserotonin O-methyltransferase-like protein-like protein [Basidiobolus meristosporus CBS 931.73]|eukprot:ORX98656.1 N-acetylserotonin O-methyltransferase-like protein-like protein [Basidiobolus meristosporus CBS 931.73]